MSRAPSSNSMVKGSVDYSSFESQVLRLDLARADDVDNVDSVLKFKDIKAYRESVSIVLHQLHLLPILRCCHSFFSLQLLSSSVNSRIALQHSFSASRKCSKFAHVSLQVFKSLARRLWATFWSIARSFRLCHHVARVRRLPGKRSRCLPGPRCRVFFTLVRSIRR